MKKDAYYFSHDSNARNDLQIIKLRRQLGLEGYGIFWCLIEILRDTSDHKILMTAIEDIAFQINAPREKVEAVIKGYDLFKIELDSFYSQRLLKSMEIYNNTRKTLSEAGSRGMATRWAKKETTIITDLKEEKSKKHLDSL